MVLNIIKKKGYQLYHQIGLKIFKRNISSFFRCPTPPQLCVRASLLALHPLSKKFRERERSRDAVFLGAGNKTRKVFVVMTVLSAKSKRHVDGYAVPPLYFFGLKGDRANTLWGWTGGNVSKIINCV